MDFNLTQEDVALLELYKQFTDNEVRPIAAEVDATEEFPMETVRKMAKLGMFGIPFPREYGGSGGTYEQYVRLIEELGKACGTTACILSTHCSLACGGIYEFGTEAQKQKYLPALLKGEKMGGFGLTEPNAGTDASAQQTTAVLVGDHYILNGSKIFITNAGVAETYIIMAMTDKSLGLKGISAFIVESSFEGFSVGKKEMKMGIRGSATAELIFNNCKVPKENLLGKEGGGFKVAMKTLDSGRIGIASQALGIAQGALDEAVKYVKERKQFGKPISVFQNTQFQVASMDTQIDAARQLVYKAANRKQSGHNFSVEAARAKLFASETAMAVTTQCVQLHGGYGYTREYPMERMMRDAKITEIYEGTSEVQRMVIAGSILR